MFEQPLLAHALCAASSTASPSRGVKVGVDAVIRMTGWAFRLRHVVVRAVKDSVAQVLTSGAVGQVAQPVVVRDPVEMTNFMSFWTRTDEGLDNELVDVTIMTDACAAQRDLLMSIASRAGLQDLASLAVSSEIKTINAPHTSEIRNLVGTFPSHDGQPAFGRLVHIDSSESRSCLRTVTAVAEALWSVLRVQPIIRGEAQ